MICQFVFTSKGTKQNIGLVFASPGQQKHQV